MADEHFYLGIDLGTTNSVICWVRYRRRLGFFEPSVLEIEHLGSGRKSCRTDLLPSVVYFPEGGAPIVGELARTDAYLTQPHLVVRSVKSRVGSGQDVQVGRRSFSPAYISSLILNQLRAATKDKFGIELDDVVITVPASFDADMRADTLEAARLAGFKVKDSDGTVRDMLLDEPRAALHYLIYQQQIDEIPSVLIDFTSPKTVLIFDLGGGTLDVSLHTVQADYESIELNVEDIAISRYTRIGGDNFDELIAAFFQREFEARYGIEVDTIPERYIQHEIKSKLLLEAEAKKREINNQFAEGIKQRATLEMLRPRIAVETQIPNLYDNKGYWSRLGWDQLEELIAPLMGHDLNLESVENFEELDAEQANNIIYPILDVLCKAKRRMGALPEIDAVFLNGGMTRFLPVQLRLTEFFGKEPLTLLDPDKSVALGASLYHHALHQGIRPRAVILAESIGIELKGGYVKHLVPAGTVVPMPKPQPLDELIIQEGASEITIPFYRGERKDTQPPNVKLLERVVELPYTCTKDELLVAEVYVDANKTLTFHGYLKSDASVEIEVTVRSSGEQPPQWPKPTQPRPLEPTPTGPALDIEQTIHQLITSREKTEGAIKSGIETQILQASNRQDFIAPLAEAILNASPSGRLRKRLPYRRAMLILGTLGAKHPDHEATGRALGALIEVSRSRLGSDTFYMNQIVDFAVVAMGRLQSPAAETALLDVLDDPAAAGAYQMALVALAKVSRSANALATVNRFVSDKRVGVRMNASWALGKMGSRDNVPPMPVSPLLPAVEQLLYQIERERHVTARQMMVYALGEICDQRHADRQEVVPKKNAQDALKALENVRASIASQAKLDQNEQDLKRTMNTALSMVRGEKLEEEQERVLLKFRSRLDEA
jgi:molecular chaperone DnaK (HSP70)